jgi:hypothetical protein
MKQKTSNFERYLGKIKFMESAALVLSSLAGALLANATNLNVDLRLRQCRPNVQYRFAQPGLQSIDRSID